MKAEQMQARARHQRGQSLHKLQRRQHDVARAILIGTLQLQHHLAHAVATEPFIGNGGAGDIAAQPFQCGALRGVTAHRCVQAKAVRAGAQGWLLRAPRRALVGKLNTLCPARGPSAMR